jgi:hypothetical protein
MPAAEKRRFAHIVFDASGSLEATDVAAAALASQLAVLAERAPARPPVRETTVRAALQHGPLLGPRGLDPVRFAAAVGAAGGMELERLKGLLVPPFEGPWTLAAQPTAEGSPGPEAVALVVGLWSLVRRGLDPEFTAAAMLSVAYLIDGDGARTAGACLLALAAAHLAAGARPTEDERTSWTATAEKWARGRVPSWAEAIVEAIRLDPIDRVGAREAARRAGIDPRLADGLIACVTGASDPEASPAVVTAARALVETAADGRAS